MHVKKITYHFILIFINYLISSISFNYALATTASTATSNSNSKVEREDKQTGINNKTTNDLHLFVGESHLFTAPKGLSRITIGSNQLLQANAINDQEILLSASQAGITTLSLWNEHSLLQQIRVHILPSEILKTQREVADFVASIPGASAKIVGDKVILEGENLSDSDQEKITEIAKRYPQVINFTNRIGWEKMISIDVKVVEFPTAALRQIGIEWQGTSKGGGNIGINWNTNPDLRSGPFAFLGINALLLSQLHLLAQKGDAAILAEPKLSTRHGSTATFFAGGEIPYQIVDDRDKRSVTFKPYGVKLEIQPRVDQTGVIRAIIETEVSSIDTSLDMQSGPALRTRKTKAEFNLHNGETMILSGFLTREQIRNQQKLPGLGDLPVIGSLFRSEKFQQRETELVIFVTPRITDTHDDQHAQKLQEQSDKIEHAFEQQ